MTPIEIFKIPSIISHNFLANSKNSFYHHCLVLINCLISSHVEHFKHENRRITEILILKNIEKRKKNRKKKKEKMYKKQK